MGQDDDVSLSSSEQLTRWLNFLDQWEKALNTGKECIVMGDFNMDFLTFNGSNTDSANYFNRIKPLVMELFTRILPYGVKQCVLGATRQGRMGQVDRGLDHVWTNIPGKLSQVHTKLIGSDHKLLFVVRYCKVVSENTRYIRKRSYKKFDPQSFLSQVKKISWWDIYVAEDPDEAIQHFTTKINDILDKMAPIKVFQSRSKYCPWLSEQTKHLLKLRNEAQQRYSREKTDYNYEKFKKLRNRATNQLRKDKIGWQKKKLQECSGNSSLMWKNVLGWLNWSSTGSPSRLFHGGRLFTSPKALAEIMNNFFIEKICLIRQKLPAPNEDPLKMLKHLMKDRKSTFSFSAVHPDVVHEIIINLKNSKTCGVDNIDTYIIKMIAHEIVPAITHIINLSIQQASFPSLYKNANVIPLFRKGYPWKQKTTGLLIFFALGVQS